MTGELTRDDVAQLLSDPSPQTRAIMAAKVGAQMDNPALSPGERKLAEDILRAAARDTSQMVREALAKSVKASRSLPHDLVMTLARDIDQVAFPILEFSEVLTETDLVSLVRDSADARKLAIARRSSVPGSVADALVDTGSAEVVGALVGNEGAALSDAALGRVVDRFGTDEGVQGAMVGRTKLPVAIAERLVATLSDRLRDHLVARHELSPDTASELVLRARERATLNLVPGDVVAGDVHQLAAGLHANRRLTPSIVLRALCVGDMAFFEAAMAVRAGVPLENARILIHDQGQLGLTSIYRKADLPPALLSSFRAAVAIVGETSAGAGDQDRESFSRMVIERILTQCEDLQQADIDYLLRKLDDLAPDSAAA